MLAHALLRFLYGTVVVDRASTLVLQAAVQESARLAAYELQKEVGTDRRPLAKLCPRVAELASKLLQRDDNACVSQFAVLPEVQRLSATVYSYGLHV